MLKAISFLAQVLWIKEYGWLKGVVIILVIYVHEFGHYVQAHMLNLNPKYPRFIPFLGAFVSYDETLDEYKQFQVAYAGPLAGGLVGILSYYLAIHFKVGILLYFALISIVLNLVNLMPFSVLDGGRIIRALGWHEVLLLGVALAIVVALKYKLYFILFIAILGLVDYVYVKIQGEKLRPMTKKQKGKALDAYLYLVFALGFHLYYFMKHKAKFSFAL